MCPNSLKITVYKLFSFLVCIVINGDDFIFFRGWLSHFILQFVQRVLQNVPMQTDKHICCLHS